MRGRIKRHTETRTMEVPIIGKIKCGKTVPSKTKNGKPYDRPVSLDHFIATGKYASHFHQTFGEKPSTIPVAFISDDVASVCNERYEIRDQKGRLYGRGDGEVFEIWSTDKGEYVRMTTEETPGLMEKVSKRLHSSWKAVLELRFLIPDIRGVVGVWQLHTSGEASSIPQIIGAFDFVLERATTVVGVPFDLQVEKVTSQKPESTSTFPVISLVPNISNASLEKLHDALEAGFDVRRAGLLTDGKIDEMIPKQLEAPKYETVVEYGDPSEMTPEEKAEYGIE